MCCSPSHYLHCNIWYTAHFHAALTDRNFSIPLQKSFIFSPIHVSHFLFYFFSFPLLFVPSFILSFPYLPGLKHVFIASAESDARSKIEPCIASSHCGINRNDGFSCAPQHRQSPWDKSWNGSCPHTQFLQRKIAVVMRANASVRLEPLKVAMFASFLDHILLEIGTRNVWGILRASLAIATSAENEPSVREFFYTLFRNR